MSLDVYAVKVISIHAPREGGDLDDTRHLPECTDFNPRPPRGGRQGLCAALGVPFVISIHAPREGGDHCSPLVLP